MIRPKRHMLSALAGMVLIAGAPGVAPAQTNDAVAIYSPIRPVTAIYHGVTVSESYRWLEYSDTPLVQTWTETENQRTRGLLDGLKSHETIKRDLTRLITGASPAYFRLRSAGAHVLALYNDPKRAGDQLMMMNAQADPASRQVLLDPLSLAPKGQINIEGFTPSPDGRRVAVWLSKSGGQDSSLHIYDVATGQEIGSPLPNAPYGARGGGAAWSRDGAGLWYVRGSGETGPPGAGALNQQVYFHRLDSAAQSDALALGPGDGLERISEIHLDGRYGRTQVVASVQRGDGGEWAHYVLQQGHAPIQAACYADQIAYAVIGPDDALYGLSYAEAPNGRVVKLAAAGGYLASAPTIVPQSDAVIAADGAALGFDAHHLFVRDSLGGPQQVRVFDLAGRPLFKLPLPPVASNSEIEPLADGDVLFDVSTYLEPRVYLRWTPSTGATQQTGLAQTSPIGFGDMEIVQATAKSRDATPVPLTVIRRAGQRLDGKIPTLLYADGGDGHSQSPSFLGALPRLWLDAGGVYAIAHVRGDGEYGPLWRQFGAGAYKQNMFDDFAAAAQSLIDTGYTSRGRLAFVAGDHSGPLIGAMITQHPGLARAVVSSGGAFDMLRLELDPAGAFSTPEFGSAQDADAFKTLYSYSPYHHVRPGAFPAMLLETGGDDERVNPWQSRKFVAAIQAANTSGLPVLLRGGDSFTPSETIDRQADRLAFLLDQLQVRYQPLDR